MTSRIKESEQVSMQDQPNDPNKRGFVLKAALVLTVGGFGLTKIGQACMDMSNQVQSNIGNSFPRSSSNVDQNEAKNQQATLYRINQEMQRLFKDVKYTSRLSSITYTAFVTKHFFSQHVEDSKGIEASSFPDSYKPEGDTVVNPFARGNERQIYAWNYGADIEDGDGFNTFIKRRDEKTGEEEVWTVKLPEDGSKPYFWRINYTDALSHTNWRVSFFAITIGDKGEGLQRSPAFDGESFLKPPMIINITNPYASKK